MNYRRNRPSSQEPSPGHVSDTFDDMGLLRGQIRHNFRLAGNLGDLGELHWECPLVWNGNGIGSRKAQDGDRKATEFGLSSGIERSSCRSCGS